MAKSEESVGIVFVCVRTESSLLRFKKKKKKIIHMVNEICFMNPS